MSYFCRLRDFWFPNWSSLAWVLLALPALYFTQTLVHEGLHTLAAWSSSGEFPKLAPFPHESTSAGFRNGVAFTGGSGFIATPQFVELGLVVILALVCWLAPIGNRSVRFVLRLWFLGLSIDLLYNTARELVGGHNRFADWSRFQDVCELGQGAMVVISLLFWLVVLLHFVWVYFSAWHRCADPELGFWDYRWIAFGLGLLSLCAILFSGFVSDPTIDKATAAFVVPLILQVAAVAWCTVYFTLSFTRTRTA